MEKGSTRSIKPFILIIPILFLVSCSYIANPNNWETIPVDKYPGSGHETWTFKRSPGFTQEFMWLFFGNDNDGCEPNFQDEDWSFWRWWWRNRTHNFNWYGRGYARWIEGDPWASWDTSHLEYKTILGADPPDDSAPGWQIRLVKPKKRTFLSWRPFICYNGKYWRAWWGWARRGQHKSAMHFGKED